MIIHVNRLKPYHDSSRFKVLEETDTQSNSDSSDSEELDIREKEPDIILKKKTLVKKAQDRQTEDISRAKNKQRKKVGRPRKEMKKDKSETENELVTEKPTLKDLGYNL